MELRQLRYFLAVAEERNLTRAAELVGIRPTSLSQQIIALERELDAALFVRTSAGMSPTPAALRLIPHARAAVDSACRAQRSVRESRALRLAVTPGAPPRFAATIWQAAGDMAAEVVDCQTAEQLSRLRAGSLDAGVLLLPADLAGLDHVVVADAELGVVVATEHRLAGHQTVDWTDLDGSALLWFARSSAPGYHDAVRASWTRAGWHPTAVRASSPRRTLFTAELCFGGDVVALRPAWEVRPGDGLTWIPFAAEAPRIRYALVWNAADSAAVRYREIAADLASTVPPQVRAALPRGQSGS
ncbi:LysR family transcriptional regulator [Nocardia goodfellowii]|uniref:DNA-binding transcriptional LysR family regulator n=1 Tax=Nocardia goodfellowii TaxID=882446 RepID=A0ABS4QG06_9NOCA|nr:LysR family transcriptional regulator [Nocardia goodfellowii]MBP2190085.1 DNA-binding transcriptional LysR family regulator [Nocardia goodfellowii]